MLWIAWWWYCAIEIIQVLKRPGAIFAVYSINPASHSPRQCRLSQGAWPVACNTWVHIKRIYIMHHIEILGRFHLPGSGRSPNRGLCWGSGGIGQLPIPGKGQGKDSTWCSCPQIEPLQFIASCTTSVHCLQPSTSLFWPATWNLRVNMEQV